MASLTWSLEFVGTTLHDQQQQGHWSTQTPPIIRNLLRLFDELIAMLKVFKNKQKTHKRSVGSYTHEYLWSALNTILIQFKVLYDLKK
jgi:hypothetical protein